LRTHERRLDARVLDVSQRGMFVAGDTPPTGGAVHVSIPIDDRGTPILATARVARAIHENTAKMRGISQGVGLEIVSLSGTDARRFQGFVGRVARRAVKEVIVGAAQPRVGELIAELAGAGYAATGVSDAPALVARTAAARPPDLVVLDSSLSARTLHVARRALGAPCAVARASDGDAPAAAREQVDSALLS